MKEKERYTHSNELKEYLKSVQYCKTQINEQNYRLRKENLLLIKQLHDLPNKIVGEVEKNFTEYLPLKYKTGAGFYLRLNTILKKYGDKQ